MARAQETPTAPTLIFPSAKALASRNGPATLLPQPAHAPNAHINISYASLDREYVRTASIASVDASRVRMLLIIQGR